jgi:hypothetical protein
VHGWLVWHGVPDIGRFMGQSMLEQHTHDQVPIEQVHVAAP